MFKTKLNLKKSNEKEIENHSKLVKEKETFKNKNPLNTTNVY